MRFAWLAFLLAGCSSKPEKIPTQPTTPSAAAKLESGIDTRSSKVAAAVTVVKENAGKPEVVKAESALALSFLPTPSEGDVALARQRAGKADQKDYDEAVKFGKNILAQIDDARVKMDADRREAARISGIKDARIAELTKEIETVKKEAAANIWTLTGAGLVVVGGLACAFSSIRIGIPIIVCGAFAGSLPFFFDSAYFGVIATVTLAIVAGLGVWWIYDRVKDSVNESDVKAD
jgi:hypothetical protein